MSIRCPRFSHKKAEPVCTFSDNLEKYGLFHQKIRTLPYLLQMKYNRELGQKTEENQSTSRGGERYGSFFETSHQGE